MRDTQTQEDTMKREAKIEKAYKYGVDRSGTIWVNGADFQKYYDKRAGLLQRHEEAANESSDKMKKFAQERLDVLEKYQTVSKHSLSSDEQILLHAIVRDILKKQGRVA